MLSRLTSEGDLEVFRKDKGCQWLGMNDAADGIEITFLCFLQLLLREPNGPHLLMTSILTLLYVSIKEPQCQIQNQKTRSAATNRRFLYEGEEFYLPQSREQPNFESVLPPKITV